MAQQLFGRPEEQADAYRSFFGQWGNVPAMTLPVPRHGQRAYMFPFQRQGMLVAAVEERGGDSCATVIFPIAGYDEKNVDEISARLDGLSAEQIRHLRATRRPTRTARA